MDDRTTTGREFLGTGLAMRFEPAVDLELDADGRFKLNRLEDQVRQSILLILQTAQGERVMRPELGAGLQRYVFEPITSAMTAMVRHQVEDALVRFEPRIEVEAVRIDDAGGRENVLLVDLTYRVRSTDTSFNLVYPFYLERGEQ